MNKKMLKVLGAGGLALFMGVGTLCGVLLAPMNSAQASTSSEETALTPQEQLLAGTLELNPENDPVVFTTDYGLEIKWHMASTLPLDSSKISSVPSGQKLASYAYFTYADVNWVIIGYSNKTATFSAGASINIPMLTYYSSISGYLGPFASWTSGANTSAKTAIYDDYLTKGKDIIYNGSSSTAKLNAALFPNAKASSELEGNEVLCFAQNNFSTLSRFNDSMSKGNCYYNSRLMTTMNSFYNSNLTDLPIVEKSLKTVWSGASDTTNGSYLEGTYKIFPLAGANKNESFYVLNYLTSGSDAMQQGGVWWWLRTGRVSDSDLAYYINPDGTVNTGTMVHNACALRPAFVLEI